MDDTQTEGIKKDLEALSKLEKINKSAEFNDYFDFILKTAADKMLWAFIGDGIKTWDEFLKTRAEITAYLFPIQEVRSATAMKERLNQSLKDIYGQNE